MDGNLLHERHPAGKQTTATRWGGDLYLTGPIIPEKLGIQLWGDLSSRDEDEVLDGVARHKKQNGTARLWFAPVDGQEFMIGMTRQEQGFRTTPGKTTELMSKGRPNSVAETEYDRTQYDFSYNGRLPVGNLSLDCLL